MKMKNKKKKAGLKLSYLILAVVLMILQVAFLQSCKDGEKNRVSFIPKNGVFEVMLDPEDWTIISLSLDNPSSHQLALFNRTSAAVVYIECYKKSALSDLGIAELDSFITFCGKSIERIKDIYENENGRTDELNDVAKNIIKKSIVNYGKRQKIYLTLLDEQTSDKIDVVNEFVYLESEDYFFTLQCYGYAESFDECQKATDEILSHIKTQTQTQNG